MAYLKLFETCRIGALELRNRIVMSPCTTSFAIDGFVNDKMKDHYAARAKGGAGMIIVEDAIVDSSIGRHDPNDLYIDDDKYIPGLTQLANCIKAHGARAALQINHGGRRGGKTVKGYLALTNGKIPVAPSSIAHFEPGFVVPRELAIYEIEEIIEKYAKAALRVKEAGFDSVGIHCSHTYLINQFLSPAFNKRQDEYGRDFEGRMRFVLRIIEEVRKKVGQDYPIYCRISGEEPFEGGLSLEDMKRVARRLQEAGAQAFVLSRGASTYPAATSKFVASVAPMRVPRGCLVYLAEGIKEAVQVPVGVANRINNPDLAEQILEEGKADLIVMGRPLIADPELPNKAKEGRLNEIRKCIACMWCMHKPTFDNPELVCAVNARVGRNESVELAKAEKVKKVLVIGGGPAGMEAARVAAVRGHEVHLYESSPQLGGQLVIASIPPGRQEIDELTGYLTNEMKRLKVNVKKGTPVTLNEINRISPDVIISAIGSKPLCPPIPGIDQDNVVNAREVLQGKKEAKGKVVVLGGGQVGAELAEYLVLKGKDVTIVEMLDQVAIDAPFGERPLLLLSLKENGVKIMIRAKAEKVIKSGVVVRRQGKEELVPADNIICALGSESDRSLANVLAGRSVLWIGDCVEPRNIFEAIHEGYEVGVSI